MKSTFEAMEDVSASNCHFSPTASAVWSEIYKSMIITVPSKSHHVGRTGLKCFRSTAFSTGKCGWNESCWRSPSSLRKSYMDFPNVLQKNWMTPAILPFQINGIPGCRKCGPRWYQRLTKQSCKPVSRKTELASCIGLASRLVHGESCSCCKVFNNRRSQRWADNLPLPSDHKPTCESAR